MTKYPTTGCGRYRRVRRGTHLRAFTFIEIMMVVLIIGMLAAIVMPTMTGRAEKARRTQAKGDMSSIVTGLTMYEMNLGEFPTSDQGLDALVRRPSDVPEDKWEKSLPSIPKDPWGSPYVYRSPGDAGRDFDLFTIGRDRKEGTDDDLWAVQRDEGAR